MKLKQHIISLLIASSFLMNTMPQETGPVLKRAKTTSELIAMPRSPAPLAQRTAEYIVANFATYSKYIPLLSQDIRDNYLSPQLITLLKVLFIGNPTSSYGQTGCHIDSDCSFNKDGTQIISIHRSANLVELHSVNDVLAGNFTAHFARILEPHITACNKYDALHCITSGKGLEKYAIVPPPATSSRKNPVLRCIHERPIGTTINYKNVKQVFTHPSCNGLFALQTIPNKQQELLLYIDSYGISKPIANNDITKTQTTIKSVHPLEDNQVVIVYENGNGCLIHPHTKKAEELCGSQAAQAQTQTSCVNPANTKLAVGLNDGTLLIYDIATRTCKKIDPAVGSEDTLSTIHFYDDKHLITIHKNKKTRKKKQTPLRIWNIESEKPVATVLQRNPFYDQSTNTAALSPAKDYLLMGTYYYDIYLRSMDSFEYDMALLDPEKMYTNPAPLCEILKNYPQRLMGILMLYNIRARANTEEKLIPADVTEQNLPEILKVTNQSLLTVPEKLAFMATYMKDQKPQPSLNNPPSTT